MSALSQSLLFTPAESVGTTSTVAVVYPNTATSTLVYLSEKAKGDGYYGASDGLHTVMYVADSSFIGSMIIEATLATEPSKVDWFPILDTEVFYNEFSERPESTTTDMRNFVGNFVWVRGRVTIDQGTVLMVQYNH
jgi:hypothetical protein